MRAATPKPKKMIIVTGTQVPDSHESETEDEEPSTATQGVPTSETRVFDDGSRWLKALSIAAAEDESKVASSMVNRGALGIAAATLPETGVLDNSASEATLKSTSQETVVSESP